MRLFSFIFAIAACLAGLGLFVLPNAWGAAQWLLAGDDPLALTRLGLRSKLTPERLNLELKAALDGKSKYLADSFMALAEQERVAVAPDLRKRYDEEAASYFAPIERFAEGLWDGKCTSSAGFTGSRISDLLIVGDLRDLFNEADKYGRGTPVDPMVIGLASVGLVSTAAVPAHTAISAIKGVAKAGQLSQPFRAELTAMLAAGLDIDAAVRAVSEVGFWDWVPALSWQDSFPEVRVPLLTSLTSALRSLVRPDQLTSFRELTGDLVTLASGDAGICGAQDALAVIHSAAELKRVVRLAEERKAATAAILKLLGRDALILLDERRSASMSWIGGGVGYILLTAALLLWRTRRASRR